MNENDILKGRLKDLANAAFRQNRYKIGRAHV